MVRIKRHKFITENQHAYNLFVGFTIAVEIAWIFQGINILRTWYLGKPADMFDIVIFLLLMVVALGEEIITRILFVKKPEWE